MEDFYMVLLSNTSSFRSSIYDRSNTVSEFTTQLPHNIELGNDKWECALCSISYLHSWYDIDEDTYIYIDMFEIEGSSDHTEERRLTRKKILIPKGHYDDDGNVFASMLTEKLSNSGAKSRFQYKPRTNTMVLIVSNEETITMEKYLAHIMGFQFTTFSHSAFHTSHGKNSMSFETQNAVDFNLKTHNLFVYCDILENTLLGGYYNPLLALVPTKKENYNTYVTKTFTDRHYLPMNSSVLSRIKISIKDDRDQNIKIRGGRTSLKLHFRKKKIYFM